MPRVALLVACYEYQDPSLRRLVAPGSDAEALAEVLRDPDIAGFEVTTLINEPHYRVGEAIGEFFASRRPNDLALLYFTGHGLKGDDGNLYLAMPNTRKSSLLFTSIGADQIDRAMADCRSRRQVLVLDCCFSGAFPAGGLAKADDSVHALQTFSGRGRSILTASDATQYAFEGDTAHGEASQSVFTRFLVEGLRDGTADLNGDGNITVEELYQYVYERVVEHRPQQRPKKVEDVDGPTVLAANVKWMLPSYVRNGIASPLAADRRNALDGLENLYRLGNAVVRSRVIDEVRRLSTDDSRSVAAAAEGWLAAQQNDSGVGTEQFAGADAGSTAATAKAADVETSTADADDAAPAASSWDRHAPQPAGPREGRIADAAGTTITPAPTERRDTKRRNIVGLSGDIADHDLLRRTALLFAVAAAAGVIPPIVTLSTNYRWQEPFWFFQDFSKMLLAAAFALLAWRAERSTSMAAVVIGYLMMPVSVLLILDHLIAFARRSTADDQVFRLATEYAYPILLAMAAVVAIIFGYLMVRAERRAWALILVNWGLIGLVVAILSFWARRSIIIPPIADSILITQNLLLTTVPILMWREAARLDVAEDHQRSRQ